jgi:hypothetical protein
LTAAGPGEHQTQDLRYPLGSSSRSAAAFEGARGATGRTGATLHV